MKNRYFGKGLGFWKKKNADLLDLTESNDQVAIVGRKQWGKEYSETSDHFHSPGSTLC